MVSQGHACRPKPTCWLKSMTNVQGKKHEDANKLILNASCSKNCEKNKNIFLTLMHNKCIEIISFAYIFSKISIFSHVI